MNIIMSYFCFLLVQAVSFCGHIARNGQWSLHPLRFASPPFRGGAQPYQLTFLPQRSTFGRFFACKANKFERPEHE